MPSAAPRCQKLGDLFGPDFAGGVPNTGIKLYGFASRVAEMFQKLERLGPFDMNNTDLAAFDQVKRKPEIGGRNR